MYRKTLSTVCSFLVLAFITQTAFALNLADEERRIFELVNQERIRQRLAPLVWDDSLSRIARDYSRRMGREGFFDHQDPEGKTAMDRAERARLRGWSRIGENLFFCDPVRGLPAFAVRGWMRSPTHRENMLDRGWTATGIGITEARDGSLYITQLFTDTE